MQEGAGAFVLFEFFAVILMALIIGLIGSRLSWAREKQPPAPVSLCDNDQSPTHFSGFSGRMKSALKFAFYELPKDIGLEIFIGIVLAAIVVTAVQAGQWIKQNLSDFRRYLFSVGFSLIMYICSTATVPLVDAFLRQGACHSLPRPGVFYSRGDIGLCEPCFGD